MAKLRKRASSFSSQPGLFDDFEIPVPATGRRRGDSSSRFASDDMFAEGDVTPLEDVAPIDRLQFISFGSGSSGNCAYIGDETTGVLIDAGVDADSVSAELSRYGIGMDRVKAIVLTHDHSDHVRFVYSFVRKHRHIAVCCTPKVLNGMLRRHSISNRLKDYHRPIYKEHPFNVGQFTFLAFEVLHDGTDNAGYFITHGRHKMAVATDLGCVSERVDHYMRQANYIVIESNYDDIMLGAGSYPEYLKARIRSNNGHLDNEVTAAYLAEIWTPELRNIFLCHLSKDNNRPEIAVRHVDEALTAKGIVVGDGSGSLYSRRADVQLMALPRFDSTGMITLR